MTALDQNPDQKNFLSPNSFKFLMKRAPNIEFFIQKCNIPATSTSPIAIANPRVVRPTQGGPISYEPLDITFKVGEDLGNYLEVYNWMHASSFSTQDGPYKNLKDQPRYSDKGLTSDIVVTILSSSKTALFEIVYHDAFPIYIGEIGFESDNNSVDYSTCQCRFSYHFFEIARVDKSVDPNNIVGNI